MYYEAPDWRRFGTEGPNSTSSLRGVEAPYEEAVDGLRETRISVDGPAAEAWEEPAERVLDVASCSECEHRNWLVSVPASVVETEPVGGEHTLLQDECHRAIPLAQIAKDLRVANCHGKHPARLGGYLRFTESREAQLVWISRHPADDASVQPDSADVPAMAAAAAHLPASGTLERAMQDEKIDKGSLIVVNGRPQVLVVCLRPLMEALGREGQSKKKEGVVTRTALQP